MRPLLVQPAPGERVSGGYLYNAQMAAHGAWELANVGERGLAEALSGLVRPLVIADSIWLREDGIEPFLALSARGTPVAVMMHSFPSMIATAESGKGVRALPTAFELEALEQLGTMLVPGPHYAHMLAHTSVRTLVLPPGIHARFREPPRPRRARCEIVSIGAVTPRKGFLDLAEILAERAAHDDYHWTVVGDLTLDPAYAQAVFERVGSLPSVSLLGTRTPEETSALLKRAHLLVMPSYDENHPLVLLEALAAGVPALAYAAGAAREITGHGKAGIVCEIGDQRALQAGLESLIGNEKQRFLLAQGAAELGQALLSWEEAGALAASRLATLVQGKP